MRIAPDCKEMMGVHVCRAVRVRPVCAFSKYLRILPTRQSINRHQAHHDRGTSSAFQRSHITRSSTFNAPAAASRATVSSWPRYHLTPDAAHTEP